MTHISVSQQVEEYKGEVTGVKIQVQGTPNYTDADLAAAREDYLAMLRQELQYLELAGLAPRVQNRVVKIRLEDIFIPLQARPEVGQRRSLPGDVLRLLQPGPAQDAAFEGRADLDDELAALVAECEDRSTLAARLMERGYHVPGYEHGALGEGRALDIAQLLDKEHVVILGDPGSGKSTTLKYLAYAVATQNGDLVRDETLRKTPILVKVADWQRADEGLSLWAFLCRDDDPIRCALFERAIKRGEALILLDALDEVPDAHSRGRAAEGVRRLVADCPGNTVLLTSRIVGYDGARLAGHFEHVTLEPLPRTEIARFCGNWYAAIEREAEGSAEAVQAAYERAEDLQAAIEGNPGVQGLAQNPLLLTIIALVNWRGRKLPDRRVELYQHAAETLIESWPYVQHGVKLDTRAVIGILEPAAYRIFAQRGSEELGETALQPLLIRAIVERQGCGTGEAEERAAELLPQITEQSGIFVERGVDPQGRRYYGFLHQTFAEYFAARHLAERWRAGAVDLLAYARNPRWREVLLLLAGHLSLSDEQAATKLIAEILKLPDEHPVLERNLLLAAECLADDTPVQAQAARYAMGQLATLACTGPAALREATEPLLGRLGGTAHVRALLERLLDLSRDTNDDVRSRAADALGRLGGQAPPEVAGRMVERLLDLSRDTNDDVRVAIARLAATRGAERALPVLLEWLDDAEWGYSYEPTPVYRVAYPAILAILARAAPEPPAGFEGPPQSVSGPWDEGKTTDGRNTR